jgi:CHASE3 domain sensor protein
MRLDLPARLHTVDLREFGISALVAAVALFIAAMAMLNQNVADLRQSITWVEQSYVVQKRLDAVNNRLAGVEMTVRGYALTGDPAFLRRHRKTHDYLAVVMHELHDMAAVEPALLADYTELEKAVGLHEALYSSLIGLGPRQQAAVAEAITNPAKRQFNERAINALNHMEAIEQRLLAERHAVAELRARRTYGLALGIAALAVLLGSVGFALTLFGQRRNRDPRARQQEPSP